MKQKAKEILLRAKKDVFSGNLGDTITTFQGEGLDFREIRDYQSGDDIKKINWNATAKSNSVKVNLFDTEKELNIVIAFFTSGSMNFGTINLKQDIASEVLALLSFSSVKNNNNLQTTFFTNENKNFFPATKNNNIVYEIVEKSLDINCLGEEIDYNKFCTFINSMIKQKSLIFLVGDFFGDIDLSTIAHKNEIYALIIRDRFEEYPYMNGDYEFIDPIDFSSSDINITKDIAKKYNNMIKENDEKLEEHFLLHKIQHGKIYTDDDIYLKLSQIVSGGK